MLEQFFVTGRPLDALLLQQHNPWLVALSAALAIGASVMALHMAELAQRAQSGGMRRWTLGTAGLALGGGIWGMHFIDMLAFSVCAAGDFSPWVTAVSILPSVIAAWIALWLLARRRVNALTLLSCGVLVGAGIGAMHYSGMAASSAMSVMRYDPIFFGISIVVAVAMATLALWVRFGLRHWQRSHLATLVAGTVMGIAITSMHYTGMAALRFVGPANTQGHEQVAMSLVIAMVVLIFSMLVVAINVSLRFRQLFLHAQRNESRLQAVVETAVDGIFMVDGQGVVQAFNSAAERMLGWDAAEVLGQHARMLAPDTLQEDNTAVHSLARTAGSSRETEMRTRDGRFIPVRMAVGCVDVQGAPLYVSFITDIRQRLDHEQTLREARDRAEAAAAARGTFLANMSHEIRTPMNAIIGFTEALLDSPLDASQRRHLGTVHNAARSMLRLLNDILDTAKLEKGAVELEVADFSLRELCEQTLASLRITASKKRLPLELDYPQAEPEFVRGDALRLQQVLVNLVGNAIKFTERGHVRLHVRYADNELLLDVEDTGIGIAPEALERIFDPFAQADASTTRRFGGTGLGTTISHQLVELMRGRISVRSTLGRGSVFSVRLPMPLGDANAVTHGLQSARVLPALRVLAVDDVPNNLELLQMTLERGRHSVTTAHNGEDAIRLCTDQHFDIVLMDLQMPGLDGLEATRRIRVVEQAQRRKSVPIIALSASVLEKDRRDARAAGMDGFASKPLELPRLYNEIARVLGLRSDGISPAAAASISAFGDLEGTAIETPPTDSHPPIDWEKGLRLWTQAPLLRDAIERFTHEQQALPERLAALHDAGDWQSLADFSHRLRGVAGNLALGPLHTLLGQLEGAARAADAASAESALAALVPAWHHVTQALAAQASAPAEAPHNASTPCAMDAQQATQAHALLENAIAALEQGELPETTLTKLAALLPALALEPVRDAVDSFDFDQAQSLLRVLRGSLATS
ncbi:MHYT domain-containing protein [Roseateles sp.]|uniref:MHYT domain-containing protein n=1 Tax=Roseateles sp. TaxID=1971397 RepID=UPI0025DF0AE7|nr:MHYT domain-containing protein [Roseateles sp.]MBV8036134.1 response regulator [Roseateles sp.]